MKKLKMPLTALVIFAVVGSGLAFKSAKFNTPNVYCFTSTPVTSQSCAGQANGTLVTFIVQAGGISTPCTGSAVPYENTLTSCANASSLPIAPAGL